MSFKCLIIYISRFITLLNYDLIVVCIAGIAYNIQDMLLYYPSQPANARFYVESPRTFGIPFENVYIT